MYILVFILLVLKESTEVSVYVTGFVQCFDAKLCFSSKKTNTVLVHLENIYM